MNARKLKRPKMFADLTPEKVQPVYGLKQSEPKPRTAEKLGRHYMTELGRLGGKANVNRHGYQHMADIGRKGGLRTRQ